MFPFKGEQITVESHGSEERERGKVRGRWWMQGKSTLRAAGWLARGRAT